MIRVVIADDQPLIRQGFRMILAAQDDIEVVGEASDGAEAVDIVRTTEPDVVLMDIRMPTMDGIEATRHLSEARVLILTTFGHDEYVVSALRAGASGFMLKDATPEELVRSVRVVAAGDALLAPAVTTRMVARFVAGSTELADSDDQRLRDLTEREIEVLKLIASGASNPEIAERLYISENTVKTHVSHLFAKLGLRDRVHAVLFALECGLLAPPRPAG